MLSFMLPCSGWVRLFWMNTSEAHPWPLSERKFAYMLQWLLHYKPHKCTLILEDIWLGSHNHVKGLDLTAAHVHDSASIWEFHLPVGVPIQLSAPANKMCLRCWWEWSMNHLMWRGGGDLFIIVHHCIMLKPYFRWVGSHLPGLTSANALVCDHIRKLIHKNLNTCSSTLRA